MITRTIFDDFFDGHIHSFRECYQRATGDDRLTGRINDVSLMHMRESLGTTDLALALGDAVTRKMLEQYRQPNIFDCWTKAARIDTSNDFRQKHVIDVGDFEDLHVVPEKGDYPEFGAPGESGVSYSVGKRGGVVKVTFETIKNDDVGVLRNLPQNLVKSAKRTLSKYVMNMLRDNPNFSGGPLFSIPRKNFGSEPLSNVSLASALSSIRKQSRLGGYDEAGAKGRYLFVPLEMEEEAWNLINVRGMSNDKEYVQCQNVQVVPVWYWTDPNDWVLCADPNEYPTIEVSFLDGKQEPELIVQDAPTVGSLFSNDILSWKIRHIYGGSLLDYRGMYKSVAP